MFLPVPNVEKPIVFQPWLTENAGNVEGRNSMGQCEFCRKFIPQCEINHVLLNADRKPEGDTKLTKLCYPCLYNLKSELNLLPSLPKISIWQRIKTRLNILNW